MQLSKHFPRYLDFAPKVPAYCVTPHQGAVIHRFFDTSPFSPGGRYLALFRMPSESRTPSPGDQGDIVLVDLETGLEQVVAATRGFEQQMGANINWGADDRQIIYNDVDPETWDVYAVRLDHQTGEKIRLDYGVYHVSPDGLEACTGNPACKWRTQPGYGVLIPEEKTPVVRILSEDEGLFITRTDTGKGRLLLSMREIFNTCFDQDYIRRHQDGECYVFHSKYSPSGRKIMFTTRWLDRAYHGHRDANAAGVVKFNVFTCNRDGSGLQLAIREEHWQNGGHHTTWHPDETCLTMNIRKDWEKMQFATASLDGRRIRRVLPQVQGTGHPTFHPGGRFILTDTYFREYIDYGDDTAPIRLVWLEDGREEIILRVPIHSAAQDRTSVLRIDPHPAWDRTNRYVAINTFIGNTRRVLVLDMQAYTK